ncbi:MAG: hypothetical protein BGO30_02830 [Bacteroidetes bacterium 41-46]|nr:MAG: hypothetical protein BGO30_02830 [Bacteroidetes bacterium 41-46]
MNIALISLDQSWENKTANKEKISIIFENISSEKLDWIILPELTLTGFSMNTKDLAEDFENSETINFFLKLSIKYKFFISFGIILESVPLATNNLITIDQNGNIVASYAKIHPFSFAKEDEFYSGGVAISKSIIKETKVGFSICYDLRFPEIFQAMSLDVSIIVNIANWPAKRIDHWYTLLKARAIENQVFFIGVNRTGDDGNGVNYQKSSLIFNPNGEICKHRCISEEIDIYTINPEYVNEYQTSFPVKKDRQENLYKELYEIK